MVVIGYKRKDLIELLRLKKKLIWFLETYNLKGITYNYQEGINIIDYDNSIWNMYEFSQTGVMRSLLEKLRHKIVIELNMSNLLLLIEDLSYTFEYEFNKDEIES